MREIKKIVFGEALFDAIICLHGKLPPREILEYLTYSKILAADGAGTKLIEKGIMPDYVIGDMDSFYNNPLSSKIDPSRIIRINDQDTNDFEKNLHFCMENGFSNILILGFHGGELEHSLNNWSVFIRYSKLLKLCIYDEKRYGIPIRESIIIKTYPDEIVSIIPQTHTKIKTSNLAWHLDKEELTLGIREGARNLAIGEEVRIDLYEGEYLLFIDSRLPYAPSIETDE